VLIPLKGELAEKDLRLAAVIGLPFWFQAIRVGITLAVGVPIVYVLITSIQLFTSGEVPLEPLPLLVTFGPFVLYFFILGVVAYIFWLLPMRQAGRAKDTPAGRGPFEGVVTDSSFTLRNAAFESTMQWDEFVGYKMAGDLVLLRKKDSVYSLVTRSLFANDEDWERFRQHVRATVSRKHK
jgi:hypothetical protein